MSEFHVTVVRLGKVGLVPNSDSLSITSVFDYPVIFRTGDFNEGDLAVFVPVDAVMPNEPKWVEMLGEDRRVRMKKLRGVPSRGLLLKPLFGMAEGQDVREAFGIINYVAEIELDTKGIAAPIPKIDVPFYDIEGLLRYPDVLIDGEEVIISEKTHGAQFRAVFHNDQLHVASKAEFKRDSATSIWWEAARTQALVEKLASHPGLVLYGEVYGQVQDLKYGVDRGVRLVAFDMYDSKTHSWLDHDKFKEMTEKLDIPVVPMLYRGPWSNDLRMLCNGLSILSGFSHIREGFVVKPVVNRIDIRLGRVILKLVGDDYLMRKGDKKKHKHDMPVPTETPDG